MGQEKITSDEKNNLLDYSELITIVPTLKNHLNEETALEFSKSLYQFTKLIFDHYKNEKEKHNN